jgi:hypothetical protein
MGAGEHSTETTMTKMTRTEWAARSRELKAQDAAKAARRTAAVAGCRDCGHGLRAHEREVCDDCLRDAQREGGR